MTRTTSGFSRRDAAKLCIGSALAGIGATRLMAGPTAGQAALPDGVATARTIATGHIKAPAATAAALARIDALNPTIGAVVTVMTEQGTAQAASVKAGSLLAGVPILVKDLMDVTGAPTRRGSRATSDAAAQHQSAFVDALLAAGMVVVGKSQTPEFGASPTTEPLLGPITRNPVNLGHSAGGSSGGSAAAVAAGMVALAVGSDGGGSLRAPAACCGVFALKPSRGRMIDAGGPPQKIEMSVPGAVSRSVRDTAAFLSLMERRDPAAPLPPVGFVKGPGKKRLRIGINLKTLSGDLPDQQIQRVTEATAQRLRDLGHDVRPFDWGFDQPLLQEALGNSMLAALAQIGGGIARAKGVPLEETGLEPLHIRMAVAGAALSSEVTAKTQQSFEEVQAKYPATFADLDLVLTPTLAQLPRLLGTLDNPARPLADIIAAYTAFSPYTTIQNIAGAPAMSLPLGLSSNGLPIGVHVAGPIGSERMLLELAYELERSGPWRPGLTQGVYDVTQTPQQLEGAFREALADGRNPVAFARWLANIWAEEVMITHTPVLGNDGPTTGAKLGAGEVAVFTAIMAAIPDYRQENFSVVARGAVLDFHEEIVGTLPDGTVHRVPIHYLFTLENGRIAKVHGTFDPAALAPFSAVVKKAGQRTPQ